ncbi:MAG: peptidoglycan DD-metalloendopeptidase family protein [Gammaproteobacteria bacterium]
MKYEPASLRDFNHSRYREPQPMLRHTPVRWLLIALPVISLVVLALPSHNANAIRIDKQPQQLAITSNALPLPTINLLSSVKPAIGAISASDAIAHKPETPPEKASRVEPSAERPQPVDTSSADQIWKTITVSKGDSLSRILSKADVPANQLPGILKSGNIAEKLKHIRPGKKIELLTDPELGLVELNYIINPLNTIKVTRSGDTFSSQLIVKIPDRVTVTKSAQIHDSLFLAGQIAALPEKVTMELANIFGWDIDFALDIRKGDAFTVAYDELFVDGEKIGTGNIIAAEFISSGRAHKAIRFADPKGDIEYYDENGRSLRKAFIRTPVAFSRISSKFNPRRRHPVLNKIRAHKGVDYSAITGTPVKSTGSGKIVSRGRKGGYGNAIVIKHGTKYSTLYAHLSKFKSSLGVGSRVKQGQVIGYVGKSGLATGPHLHYEFLVNGVHRNPLTVQLPNAKPLPKKYQDSFNVVASQGLALLGSTKPSTVALQK